MKKEFIRTDENGDSDAWICICGNDTFYEGFQTCDKKGNPMEATEDWPDCYLCDRCGRIIHQHTLLVIGYSREAKKERKHSTIIKFINSLSSLFKKNK